MSQAPSSQAWHSPCSFFFHGSLFVIAQLLLFSQCTHIELNVSSFLTSPSCKTVGLDYWECKVIDQVTFYAVMPYPMVAGTSLLLEGFGDGAELILSNSSSPTVIVASGGYVELSNLRLLNVFGSASPSTLLEWSGIELSPDSATNSSAIRLAITSSSLILACDDYASLVYGLCSGSIVASVKVHDGFIYITKFSAAGALWQNVSLYPEAGCSSVPMQPCAVQVVTEGSQLLLLSTLQDELPKVLHILFIITEDDIILPSSLSSEMLVTANVTILGRPSDQATFRLQLDLDLIPNVWRVAVGGNLTLQNLTIVNVPSMASQYPNGLLTSLMWGVSFERLAATAGPPQLSIVNCDIVVIQAELQLFQRVLMPVALGWVIGPLGFMDYSPVVESFQQNLNKGLRFTSASGGSGRWQWSKVNVIGDLAFDQYLLLRTWAGLSSLLMPNETISELPLSLVAPLQFATLPLSTFDVAPGLAQRGRPTPGSPYGSTHMIMRRSTALSANVSSGSGVEDTGASLPAMVLSDTVIDGDPVRPTIRVLDLAGLSWIPEGVSSTSKTGYVAIGGADAAPNTTLYLRNMVLYNLQAIQPCPEPGDGEAASLAHDMCNFTSLLWLFDINRDLNVSSLGRLVLENVTLVMPEVELTVITWMLTGVQWDILPALRPRLLYYLQKMQASAKAINSQIEYLQIIGSDLSSDPPGSILFPVFSWFGITGKRVTMTSTAPLNVGPGVPYTGLILSNVSSVPDDSGSSTRSDASANLQGWQLGLVIWGSIMGALMLLGAALVLVFRKKRGYWPGQGLMKAHSSALPEYVLGDHLQQGRFPKPEDPVAFDGAHPGLCASITYTLDSASRHAHLSIAHIQSLGGSSVLPASLNSSGGSGGSTTSGAMAALAAVAAQTGTQAALRKALQMQRPSMQETAHEMALALLGPKIRRAPSQEEGRMDTRQFMFDIFESVQDETMHMKSEALDFNLLPELVHGSRMDMHRQMDAMRREVGIDISTQWELQGQLGKGAHGVVYKGMWRGMQVAIKRSIFQVMGDPKAETNRKIALREAAINASLDHPNIVRSYTYDMQPLGEPVGPGLQFLDWQLFIVQEYCNGGTLLNAIQQRWFWDPVLGCARMDHILSIAAHMAAGCSYIHSKQIIHGDLKPDNVLLKLTVPSEATGTRPSCVVKVADFGMSMRIQSNQTHVSGIRNGTPLYIAPEILSSSRASKSADIYSFGVMLWELYFGMTAWEKLMQVVGSDPKTGQQRAYYPGFFSFSSCTVPAYRDLGEACVAEDATQRPTFEQVHEALVRLQVEAGLPGGLLTQGGGQPQQPQQLATGGVEADVPADEIEADPAAEALLEVDHRKAAPLRHVPSASMQSVPEELDPNHDSVHQRGQQQRRQPTTSIMPSLADNDFRASILEEEPDPEC